MVATAGVALGAVSRVSAVSHALRSIVGSMSVEQIIRDRAAFAQRVAEESESSLTGQGLVLDTFQIQDITDDGSYLADLGRPEAAKLNQLASIAEANARQAAEQARIAAEQEIAVTQRALALKNAEIKAENGIWVLRDTGSTNGTYVNNRRIDKHELVDNDFIKFGQAMCKFKSL